MRIFSPFQKIFRARENQSLFNLKKFHFLVATPVDLHIIAMSSLHFLLGAGKLSCELNNFHFLYVRKKVCPLLCRVMPMGTKIGR